MDLITRFTKCNAPSFGYYICFDDEEGDCYVDLGNKGVIKEPAVGKLVVSTYSIC